MAKRFEIPGKGQGSVPYRVDIYDAQWSGGVTTLDGDGESQYILTGAAPVKDWTQVVW